MPCMHRWGRWLRRRGCGRRWGREGRSRWWRTRHLGDNSWLRRLQWSWRSGLHGSTLNLRHPIRVSARKRLAWDGLADTQEVRRPYGRCRCCGCSWRAVDTCSRSESLAHVLSICLSLSLSLSPLASVRGAAARERRRKPERVREIRQWDIARPMQMQGRTEIHSCMRVPLLRPRALNLRPMPGT